MSNPDSNPARWPDLRPIDVSILHQLSDGRATPRLLSREMGRQQSYVSQRLTWLLKRDIISRVDRGLYQLEIEAEAIPEVDDDE